MRPAPEIVLDAVSFGWRGQAVIRGLSGRFAPGAMVALVGPNGAGKSTLLRGIAGVLPPMSGVVRVSGGDGGDLAWLPQAAEQDRGFPITLLDMVAMGVWRRVGAWRRFGRHDMARVHEALSRVGLADLAERHLAALSGGQMQRALFARMLLQDAPVLLLDEPFAAVDEATIDLLMGLLCELNAQGRTVIAALHDLGLVRRHFDQTLLLYGTTGRAAWGKTESVLGTAALAAPHPWRQAAA